MTLDDKRIKIAESRGWTKIRITVKGAGAPERSPYPYGFPPGKNYEIPITDYFHEPAAAI